MIKENWKHFLSLLSIFAVLSIVALVGMIQIFTAADEARHSSKVTLCQNLVLADAVHQFHISIAKIEAAEGDKVERQRLIKEAINEPDISAAMRRCDG